MSEGDRHFLWVEKYRPQIVGDCVLPDRLKAVFQGIVNDGRVPHLLLSGPAGSGKTTVAKAICKELDLQYLMINASDDRNIEVLRGTIKQFASAMTFDRKRRVVILDEADYLNPQSTQPALRGVMEEFANNCSFILTCNFKNKIIEPIHSRCAIKEFRILKEEKKDIIEQIYKRVCDILEAEEVKYDKKAVAGVVVKFFPDFRRIINELQTFSKHNNEINEGILSAGSDINVGKLYKALKEKKYNEVRDWVVENIDNEPSRIYRKIYDALKDYLTPASVPQAVILIADYQYKSAFSADQEITLLAFLVELMVNCKFN